MWRVGLTRVTVVLLEVASAGGESGAAPAVVKGGGVIVWYVVSVIFRVSLCVIVVMTYNWD